ncbi:ADP-ribosylation factor isoform X2 [Selaginella moellendorffii]|uniref:ADP-ribosylation factor isoform X2 n=1 Tax=Selaginella moellendorffii TaxID=88036 RepID=UPI000D1CCCC6|nr:ADP-ribosylation factor isoform X2 [Selaginella moellendorffii]|eukprot:XP_024535770.1 ADP-ribosylation factor isoform X2 [Selaginella moellendorffii]
MPQESAGLVEWCCVWPFFATSLCCKDRKKIVIVLLGLDSSGKSTLLAKLRKEKFTSVLPTCGFSCKKWKIQDFAVYVFDLGGRKGFRGIWPHYFAEAYGAIFVLDSNDKARFSEAKEELQNAVSNTYLVGKPVLVVANKQGPGSAMRFDDIKFSLRPLEAAHNLAECKCNLQEGDAALDGDFQEGLQWLLETIQLQYKELRDRVDKDSSAQRARESRQRSERRERIKLMKASPRLHPPKGEIHLSKAEAPCPVEDLLSELESVKEVVDYEFHQSTTSLLLPGQIVV